MVYHEGELLIQTRLGRRHQAERLAGMIEDELGEAMAVFVARQPLMVVATVDADGAPWVSPLMGSPGVARADAHTLTLDPAAVGGDDPIRAGLAVGRPIGVLAIELTTRRRLRINGTLTALDPLRLAVREAFPNCPKYIQRRVPRSMPTRARAAPPAGRSDVLSSQQRALIAHADTIFVASVHPTAGADASHRGGEPGFIRVLDQRTLRIPDYAGNNMFQTLGNLAVNPRAGLAVVDFEDRRVLHLTGTTTLHLDAPEQRSWEFTIDQVLERELTGGLAWDLVDRSPFNPPAR